MGGLMRIGVGMAVLAVALAALAGAAAATNYTVDGATYTKSTTLSQSETWDDYELAAQSGKTISYSVSVTSGGCVMLFFAKGHNLNLESKFLVTYSQENCAPSYSNSFPVGSGDGTQFSIVIASDSNSDVPYKLDITVADTPFPWVGLVVVVAIIAVFVGIMYAVRSRRRKAMRAPTAPPPYPGTPPYPWAPPAQPPMPPTQPPIHPRP